MQAAVLPTLLLGTALATGGSPADPGQPFPISPRFASLALHPAPPARAEGAGARPLAQDLNAVVGEYCVACHNDQLVTGNLSLESFDVAEADVEAETAERMILKLRAGMMPPPGSSRPDESTLLTLAETLETTVDLAAARDPNPGSRRFQRLNRAEYERVIRDLLALDIDASRWLPADTYLGNFDNMSAAQALSTTLLESYMRAATEVSRLAVGNPDAPPSSMKYTNPIAVSQHAWDHVEGTPFGTRGGMVITHDFPVDGEYVFTFATLFGAGTGFEDLDLSIDGESKALLALEHGRGGNVPIETEPIFVPAGQHQVASAFVRKIEGPYEDRLSPFGWSFAGGEDSQAWANYGITALPHLSEVMVTGPLRAAGVSETPSRERIFSCRPTSPDEERPCALEIVTRLTQEAYRGPVSEAEIAGPMVFYDRAATEEGFEVGVRTALQAILASPQFIFRLEAEPPEAEPGENYRLADVDLANRLSFFLWAAAPDRELLELAAGARLSDPGVLEGQVRRMLADPRSEALATRFASQWLRLQDAEDNIPEPYLYPDFTGQLRDDLVRETQLLFGHLVREDRSLLELYTADYTFLNERLARHYGIPGITGREFRRVDYPDEMRRGVLGHGSVLLLTSMSARTSPVLRGKWVMEVLMGTPPPPPPPNIPSFEDTAGAVEGQLLSTRERLELHSSNPTCNACHRFMDPIGLALDNYDVTGRVRIRENGVALDTRGTYYDGTEVSTPKDLTDVLMKRPVPLVRNFTANLLAYATGRRMEYFDQPVVRAIAADAEAAGYRISSFIMGVVQSAPFAMSRSQPTQ